MFLPLSDPYPWFASVPFRLELSGECLDESGDGSGNLYVHPCHNGETWTKSLCILRHTCCSGDFGTGYPTAIIYGFVCLCPLFPFLVYYFSACTLLVQRTMRAQHSFKLRKLRPLSQKATHSCIYCVDLRS